MKTVNEKKYLITVLKMISIIMNSQVIIQILMIIAVILYGLMSLMIRVRSLIKKLKL